MFSGHETINLLAKATFFSFGLIKCHEKKDIIALHKIVVDFKCFSSDEINIVVIMSLNIHTVCVMGKSKEMCNHQRSIYVNSNNWQ